MIWMWTWTEQIKLISIKSTLLLQEDETLVATHIVDVPKFLLDLLIQPESDVLLHHRMWNQMIFL